jgi:hypothetical protein
VNYKDLEPGDVVWSSKGYYWKYQGTFREDYDLKCNFIAHDRQDGQNQSYKTSPPNLDRRIAEGSIRLIKNAEDEVKIVRFVHSPAVTLAELADSGGNFKGMIPMGKITVYQNQEGLYVSRMYCSSLEKYFEIGQEALNVSGI